MHVYRVPCSVSMAHQKLHVIEAEGHTTAAADSPDIPSDVRITYTRWVETIRILIYLTLSSLLFKGFE